MKKLCMILPLALILCFIICCQDKEAMEELEKFRAQAEIEEQNLELARNVHSAWTKRDYELIRASCAPDLIYYSPSNSKQLDNLEELIEFGEAYFASFPSYEVSIEDGIAKGDEVALRAIFRGTHEGEFMGIPATGNKIEFSQMLFFRVKNGKIVEMWEDFDSLGMMQQLGMELKPKEREK